MFSGRGYRSVRYESSSHGFTQTTAAVGLGLNHGVGGLLMVETGAGGAKRGEVEKRGEPRPAGWIRYTLGVTPADGCGIAPEKTLDLLLERIEEVSGHLVSAQEIFSRPQEVDFHRLCLRRVLR